MKTYKEQKKSHTTLTIIYNPKINSEKEENFLRALKEVTDLFFIFTRKENKNINIKKFSNLYGATYYGVQESKETEVELISTSLDYGVELGGGYLGYFVILKSLQDLSSDNINAVSRLGESLIEKSIWTSSRIGWDKLKEIYEDNRSLYKKIIDSIFLDPLNEIYRMYENFDTSDDMIFLREITLRELEKYFKENELYLKSFRISSFSTYITSVVDYICPETKINVDIKNAKA